MKLIPFLLAGAGTAAVVNAFAPPQLHVITKTSKTTVHSTVLPRTEGVISNRQSDLIFEDDLYMTPSVRNPPVPGSIMKMLPKDTFDIDTPTSLFYFGVDLLAVITTMGFLDVVVTSDNYHALPMWAQALCVAPLQVLTGFAMW